MLHEYMVFVLVAFVATNLFSSYIDYRQLCRYRADQKIDPYLREIIEPETFKTSQTYNYEKHSFKIFSEFVTQAVEFLMLYQYVYAELWSQTDYLQASAGLCMSTPLAQDMVHSVMFSIVLSLVQMAIGLPFSIYKTFVIEETYGFNKTSSKTFICDQLKSVMLIVVFTSILQPLVLWVVDVAGDNLIVSLAGISLAIILLFQLLIPVLIIPLFYKLTDMEDGELKSRVFKEAEKTGIPVSQIKVIDGSQRSSHSNAFVTGFSSFRKVVIFDTLIEQQSVDEICAVVNHELGHVAYHHVLVNVFTTLVQLTLMFSVFSMCLGNIDIVKAFHFTRASPFVYLFAF